MSEKWKVKGYGKRVLFPAPMTYSRVNNPHIGYAAWGIMP